jgi:ferritin
MINKNLLDAINEQINREIYSEYLYLSMVAYLKSLNLEGFASFYTVQTQEERYHWNRFFSFVLDKGGKVTLKAIAQPQVDFESPERVVALSLKHEQFITKSINELMDLARKENDHSVQSFLQWFVDEQVEEEANMEKYLNKIKLAGSSGPGLFMIDAEMAARTYAPPTNDPRAPKAMP